LYVINKRILDFKRQGYYGKNSRVDIPKQERCYSTSPISLGLGKVEPLRILEKPVSQDKKVQD
jgi:hypothetical protein